MTYCTICFRNVSNFTGMCLCSKLKLAQIKLLYWESIRVLNFYTKEKNFDHCFCLHIDLITHRTLID